MLEAMKIQNSLVAANNKFEDWNKSLEHLFQSSNLLLYTSVCRYWKAKKWQC